MSGQGSITSDVELKELLLKVTQHTDLRRLSSQAYPQSEDTRSNMAAGNETAQLRPYASDDTHLSPRASLLSSTTNDVFTPNRMTSQHAPFALSKIQTFELIEYFRFEVEALYPFVPFDRLTSIAGAFLDSPGTAPDPVPGTPTEEWGNMSDSRNLDLLSLLLACALASKTHRETEISRKMRTIVCENLASKINESKFDLKDVAIATLLVSTQVDTFKASNLISSRQ